MGSTSWQSSYNQWGWATKFLAWTLVVALCSGCSSTNLPPMGYQGKPFRLEPDERQLWSDAEKEEEKLAKLGKTYDDPLLEDYLGGVAAKLVPQEAQQAGAPTPRITVFRDPTLNSFAMPNGRIYIHTGLLSRVENEAQLSTILSRELAHVTNRHALMFNRGAQNKQIWLTALAGATGRQTPQGNYITAEAQKWARVIKAAGLDTAK